jgi:hypothetical protein
MQLKCSCGKVYTDLAAFQHHHNLCDDVIIVKEVINVDGDDAVLMLTSMLMSMTTLLKYLLRKRIRYSQLYLAISNLIEILTQLHQQQKLFRHCISAQAVSGLTSLPKLSEITEITAVFLNK